MNENEISNKEEAQSFADRADASHDYRAMSIAYGILALVDVLEDISKKLDGRNGG